MDWILSFDEITVGFAEIKVSLLERNFCGTVIVLEVVGVETAFDGGE